MELLLELLPDPSSGMRARAQEGHRGCGSARQHRMLPRPCPPTLPMTTPHPPGRQGRPVRGPCPHLPNPTAPSQLSSSPPHGLGGPWGLRAWSRTETEEWAWAKKLRKKGGTGVLELSGDSTLLHSGTGIKGVMEKLIWEKSWARAQGGSNADPRVKAGPPPSPPVG